MNRMTWLVLLVLPQGLWGQEVRAQAVPPQAIDEFVEWLEPLILEETPEALNARPRLAVDPRGGYLVTDDQAAQVRVYDATGSLVLYFGGEGDGPGEFRNLRGAARLSSGGFCTVDFAGRLAVWTGDGDLVDDFRLPLIGALGVAALDGAEVAVVMAPLLASVDNTDVPVVRVIDLEGPTVQAEFLTLPLAAANVSTASAVEGELNPTLASTFGFTWPVFDSLWVVDLDRPGVANAVLLESSHLGLNTRPVDRFRDRGGFVDWMLTATFPGAAYAAPGGGWLVSLFRRVRGGGVTFGLLRVDEMGRRIWEIERSPRLVATDPAQGLLYFQESSGLYPNRFERALLRN